MDEEMFLKELEKELEKMGYDYSIDMDNHRIILYLFIKRFGNEYVIGLDVLEYLSNKGFVYKCIDARDHIIIFVKKEE